MSDPTPGLTDAERDVMWNAIASVRDAAPRTTDDADTNDIIDAIIDTGLLWRIKADAAAAALAPVERLADEWERDAGPDSEAWRVFGPQTLSVPFAVDSIRAALAEGKGAGR